MTLELDFSAEQDLLRDTVRSVCGRHCPVSVVRELEDDETGYPAPLWQALGELDLIGLLLPVEHGGSGMSLLDGVVLYEEMGRSLAPSPHLVSAVISGGVLARAGSGSQQGEWLPRIGSGESVFAVAWLEPGGGYGPRGVQLRASSVGDDVELTGTKRHVLFAAAAGRLIVPARTGEGDTDIDLFIVDPDSEGVTLTQQHSLGSDTQYRVDFDHVRVGAADRIGAPGEGWGTWHDTMLDAAVLVAAYTVGACEAALELTVEYAKERKQFDKPLGAFQAISHYLADARTSVDGARMLVYEAAWARSAGQPVDRLAPMARLFAGDTFRDVTAMAQQVFGGIGFTLDADIQLYFRRAKQLQLSWWDSRTCEELIAAAVLDGDEESLRAG